MKRQNERVSPINDPLRKSPRQSVEQQEQEQHCDEEDQGQDDVFLVAFPHQVEEALKRIDKPGEGGVWSAGGGQTTGQLFSLAASLGANQMLVNSSVTFVKV